MPLPKAPEPKVNLGDGIIRLPNGASVPTSGVLTEQSATPWAASSSDCHGCSEMVGGGLLGMGGILPGAFGGGPGGSGGPCGNPLAPRNGLTDSFCGQLQDDARAIGQWIIDHPEAALQLCGLLPEVGALCNLALAGVELASGNKPAAALLAGAAVAGVVVPAVGLLAKGRVAADVAEVAAQGGENLMWKGGAWRTPDGRFAKPPAVIGRGMNARVIPYARENGYVWYKGAPNWEQLSEKELLAHNETQIQQWMAEGRHIIDIGPGKMTGVSGAYDMEHNVIFGSNYANYAIHWIDEISSEAMQAMG